MAAYQGRLAAMAVLSKPMAVFKAGNAQLQFYQQWQTYQGQAKGGLIRSAPLRLEGLGSLRAPVINVYKEPYKEVKEPL